MLTSQSVHGESLGIFATVCLHLGAQALFFLVSGSISAP